MRGPSAIHAFHLIILHRPHQDKMQLQREMQRVLADNQHKLLQGSSWPVDFQMNNHVRELRQVEFNALKHGFLVRIFRQHLGQLADDFRLLPVFPDDDGGLAHVHGVVGGEQVFQGAVIGEG
jgi:hypothetical protein